MNFLESSLIDKDKCSFKEAVLSVEFSFSNDSFIYETFNKQINDYVRFAKMFKLSNDIMYSHRDKEVISNYASVFHLFSDTIKLVLNNKQALHPPIKYDFTDIFGSSRWENTFVSKLLVTKTGNCHSMPYLYKILCDELNVPCHLALAPNHIYIKHRAEKGGWYNTELTSATFPIDAWLMASGYITLEAIQNGIYMDTLSEKESIALCVIDLAQGYNHKYPDNDGNFVIECCDLALKHFPDYVNAMLLKAETRLRQLQQMQKRYGYAYLKELTNRREGKAKWDEMNALYGQLINLGYRQMPEQMYVDWLFSLKKEKEKYINKQAPGATKN